MSENKYIIKYYRTKDGKIPFLEWFNDLTPREKLIIDSRLDRVILGNLGNTSNEGKGVIALRKIKGDFTYRIYFMYDGQELVILLQAGLKSKQQQKDIDLSHDYKQDYEDRKATNDGSVDRG